MNCRRVGLSAFAGLHLWVCRPVDMSPGAIDRLLDPVQARIGHRCHLQNMIDLVRRLMPTPPLPMRWRRRLLALGSGDPTRAICSTLVAEAFQSVRHPILPVVEPRVGSDPMGPDCVQEILHVPHLSLFVPRDFDASFCFEIIKPTLQTGFDHRARVCVDAPIDTLAVDLVTARRPAHRL